MKMRTYSTISNALPSIAEAMADAGVNQGLSRDLAYKLAAQTMVSLLSNGLVHSPHNTPLAIFIYPILLITSQHLVHFFITMHKQNLL